jgi:hypothetical protein
MKLYDVIIVDRQNGDLPRSWRDVPDGTAHFSQPLTGVPRWAALAWIRAFNVAERARPYGYWAIIQTHVDS